MLQITALAFERNDNTLFTNVSGTLQAGELLHVRGHNGSGKSTLLRLLAGLLRPEQGVITWYGEAITATTEHIHYVGHQNGLKPHLTAFENLALIAALQGLSVSRSTLFAILDNVQLKAETQVRHLSAGQGRRLALARLLLVPARLWILDEPMTALDVAGQRWFQDLLQQHLLQQGCAVLASHQALAQPVVTHQIQLGEDHA